MAPQRSDITKRVGQRLRELREAAGRTQDEVGERSGFSGKYISEIERGLRDPPLTTLERVAVRGVGCTLHDLLVSDATAAASLKQSHAPQPRSVRRLSEELAALPQDARRRAVPLVRAIIKLASLK